jgi:hypothetical protein
MDKMVTGDFESKNSDHSASNGARLSLFGLEQGSEARFQAGSRI